MTGNGERVCLCLYTLDSVQEDAGWEGGNKGGGRGRFDRKGRFDLWDRAAFQFQFGAFDWLIG